jgi:predicted dinucleotide-binding enzyme
MTRTLIIGTGDMAHALCHMFQNHNYKPSEHCLAISKPGLSRRFLKSYVGFHDTGVPLVHLEEAIYISDIIILAIPAIALKEFLGKHFDSMRNKILVDVTNSNVRGEDLQAMLGLTDTPWVKAFNDNGAVDLLSDKPHSKKKTVTTVCGSKLEAVYEVKRFAEEAMGFAVKIVPCELYQKIAMHQNSLGDDWVHAAYIIIMLFALCEVYALVRYNVCAGYDWYHLALQVTNKAICWTALDAFALTMLPGLLARFQDAIYDTKMLDKPKWLIFGLRIRKPLGLLAL